MRPSSTLPTQWSTAWKNRFGAPAAMAADRSTIGARATGATVLVEPHDESDEHGTVRLAAIATYG